MFRRAVVPVSAVAVLVLAVGCSSGGGRPAAAGSASPSVPAGAAPGPTGPNAALCAAARSVVAAAEPTFAADADDVLKQAGDSSAFYTGLLLVISEDGGSDPVSSAVGADAGRLEKDYNAVDVAQQESDLAAQSTALQSVVADLGQMTKDQVAFDAACGIPTIVST